MAITTLVNIKKQMANKKFDEVSELLDNAFKDNQNDPEYLVRRAIILSKRFETLEEAEKILVTLLDTEVADTAYDVLGNVYIRSRKYDKARECFKALVNVNTRSHMAKFKLAKIDILEENYDAARKKLKFLYKTEKKDIAMLETAKIDLIEDNVELARNRLKGLLKTDVAHYANLELGRLEAYQKRYLLAEQYFRDAMGSTVDHFALYELGTLEMHRKNYEKAEEYFKTILEKNMPNSYDAHLNLGKIYKRCSKYDLSRKHFSKILTSKISYIATFEMGKLCYTLEEYDEAINYFNNLLNTPFNQKALTYLVLIYIVEKNYKEAYNILNQIMDDTNYVNFLTIKRFLEYKLEYRGKESLESKNYFFKQLTNYDRETAIEHISLHLDENSEKCLHTVFTPNVDVNKLYDDCLEIIGKMAPLAKFVTERYFVELPYETGVINKEVVHNVTVVTLPDTKDILTIYPSLQRNEVLLEDEIKIENSTEKVAEENNSIIDSINSEEEDNENKLTLKK